MSDPESLGQALIQRTAGLARLMYLDDRVVLMAVGDIDGTPVTAIVAVGWPADTLRDMGHALAERIKDHRAKAQQN